VELINDSPLYIDIIIFTICGFAAVIRGVSIYRHLF
jgi:hypothetical protein